MLTGGCVGVAVGVLGVGVGCMVGVGATVGVIVGSVVGWVGVSVGCAVGVGVVSSALNVQVLSTAQSSAQTTGKIANKEKANRQTKSLVVLISVIPSVTARCHFGFMKPSLPACKHNHHET